MKTQSTQTGERYQLNLKLMTNKELIREHQSTMSLRNSTSGEISERWDYKAELVENELKKAGVINSDGTWN